MNTKFSIDQNMIVKSEIPQRGIVCSNPERVKRLANYFFPEIKVHTESWGVNIFTGKDINNNELFFASAPMGASGSAHAFHELMAAGGKYIIRMGSNDVWIKEQDLNSIVIIKEARGLRGISWDNGIDEVDEPILVSGDLLQKITDNFSQSNINYDHRVCFNVDDYHSYLYPELAFDSERIKKRLNYYESFGSYCRDMETASLLLKARKFNIHAASVLQNVVKQKKESPYDGEAGKQAMAFEKEIAKVLIKSLNEFTS